MKKELFMNCLRDTGLQALMTECLGEVAAGQTAAQMYLEFEESAAASRSGDAEFNARLGEARLLIAGVSDPDNFDYYNDVFKKLFGLGRTLKAYQKLGAAQEKTLGLLQIAKELLEACGTVAARKFDNNPDTIAAELRALHEFPQRYSKELAEIGKRMTYIRRELSSLPLIKLRFSSSGGKIYGCELELTGKVPEHKQAPIPV